MQTSNIENKSYVLVRHQKSSVYFAVLNLNYYNNLIKNTERLPWYYEFFVYQKISSPFSFTSLNSNLFIASTPFGLTLNAKSDYSHDLALRKFHLDLVEQYKLFSLNPDLIWIDYLNDIKLGSIFSKITQEINLALRYEAP